MEEHTYAGDIHGKDTYKKDRHKVDTCGEIHMGGIQMGELHAGEYTQRGYKRRSYTQKTYICRRKKTHIEEIYMTCWEHIYGRIYIQKDIHTAEYTHNIEGI